MRESSMLCAHWPSSRRVRSMGPRSMGSLENMPCMSGRKVGKVCGGRHFHARTGQFGLKRRRQKKARSRGWGASGVAGRLALGDRRDRGALGGGGRGAGFVLVFTPPGTHARRDTLGGQTGCIAHFSLRLARPSLTPVIGHTPQTVRHTHSRTPDRRTARLGDTRTTGTHTYIHVPMHMHVHVHVYISISVRVSDTRHANEPSKQKHGRASRNSNITWSTNLERASMHARIARHF